MKHLIEILVPRIAVVCFLAWMVVPSAGQSRVPFSAEPKAPGRVSTPGPVKPVRPVVWGDFTSERSIRADPGVKVDFCIAEGTVRVNGWNRKEIRVYVQNGNKFSFNVREKDDRTGDPNWVGVLGVRTRGKSAVAGECVWGSVIEVDVPTGATVSIKGREAITSIDSVRKVDITTTGGGISLRNIKYGISATALQGDLIVESSSGPMVLDTTTGNIVVFEASPAEIGDLFKAKANGGTISMQSVQHRQVEVGTISGSVIYNGSIRSGGAYNVSTTKGSIRMVIPADSSCLLQATYGSGSFNSELNYKIQNEDISEGPVKRIVARLGNGGASCKLTTNNGSIDLRKQ